MEILLIIGLLFAAIGFMNQSSEPVLTNSQREEKKKSFEEELKNRGFDVFKRIDRYKVSNRKSSFAEVYSIYKGSNFLFEIRCPDDYNNSTYAEMFGLSAKDNGVVGKIGEVCYKHCCDETTWVCKGSANLLQAFQFAMCKS